MSILSSLPAWLLEATVRGSAGIVLVWLLRPVCRRWLGARGAHLLWLLVLVQLLIPWLPNSPFAFAPLAVGGNLASAPRDGNIRVSVTVSDSRGAGIAHATTSGRPSSLPVRWPALVWSCGALMLAALSVVRGVRANRLVRRAPEITGERRIRDALAMLPEVPRDLRIRETDELRSPALCGLLRPTILLPRGWAAHFAIEELQCVLLHELGHFRRGDLGWRWAFLLARAVHWFNPLVWLAERSARADQEMACDEWVLTRSATADERTYGEVLLKASRLPGLTSPLHATMADSKAGLTRRVRHLATVRAHGWPAVVAALVMISALLIVIAPPATRAQGEPAPPTAPAASENAEQSAAPPVGNNVTTQIEIEAKFVELSATSLDNAPASAIPGVASRSGNVSIGQSTIDSLLFGAGGSASARGGAALSGVFADPQFQLVLRALNQSKGVDLLSAPRVTTRSGQRAIIEIIREFRYPNEFDPPKDGGPVTPKNFETRNTGVTLEVTPTIGADGRIQLELVPQVVEFLGFVNYGAGRPAASSGKGDALAALLKPTASKHVINQPIFGTRKLTTSAVLNSGQTALIGGIGPTDDEVAKSRFIARAGKPKPRDKNTERSLFIFVTARTVTVTYPPNGEPVVTPGPNPVPEPSEPGKQEAGPDLPLR